MRCILRHSADNPVNGSQAHPGAVNLPGGAQGVVMSHSSLISSTRMRAAVVVALAVVLAAVAWIVGPQRAHSVAPAAAPAAASNQDRVGTLTFTGFSTATVDLGAFSF